MSEINIEQIINSRFRTSAEADRLTVAMMGYLGLSTKANVARLAIGRSLAMGPFSEESIDAKGLELPASILFSPEETSIWIGLIKTHTSVHSNDLLDTMEKLRVAVRKHWHRGVVSLTDDWNASSGHFDRFLETLIIRRAGLPDEAPTQVQQLKESFTSTDKPIDMSVDLVKALSEIGVDAQVRGIVHGPRITRYKIFLTDVNQIARLERGLDKLSLIMNIQLSKPTLAPGDEAKTLSLDIPRAENSWQFVDFSVLREWASSAALSPEKLMVFPGVDLLGIPYLFDLAAAPHLLVGGTTGSGKSVCIHSLILSLMMVHSSLRLKLALIDPKQVEFAAYSNCPYIFGGAIATDAPSSKELIQNLVLEMESRYDSFMKSGVRDIAGAHVCGFDLPYIVVIIEELADLVLQDKDIEPQIIRLAQKARAAGIHLVLATQRPDSKTFSGLIRSNIPARIALTVQRGTESSIILDETGAEDLLGKGDMLVKAKPGGGSERVHGIRIDRSDIEAVIKERSNA